MSLLNLAFKRKELNGLKINASIALCYTRECNKKIKKS